MGKKKNIFSKIKGAESQLSNILVLYIFN